MKRIVINSLIIGVLGMFFVGCSSEQYAQSSESDDVYYNSSDRKKDREEALATTVPTTSEVYSKYNVDEENYSSKTVNPEYLSRYNNSDPAEDPEFTEEDYYVEDYQQQYDEGGVVQQQPVQVYNNYYGGFSGYYDPFYRPWSARYYRPSRWGWYDPWYYPAYGSGWNVSFGWSSWGYSGWGIGFNYGWGNYGYYDPFFCPPVAYAYASPYRYSRYGYNAGYYNGFYNGYNAGSSEFYSSGNNTRQLVYGKRTSRGSSYGVTRNTPNEGRQSASAATNSRSTRATLHNGAGRTQSRTSFHCKQTADPGLLPELLVQEMQMIRQQEPVV